MTQFQASEEQVPSDNVGAGVLARAGAASCRCEHGKANCNYDDCSADLNSVRSRDCANDTPRDSPKFRPPAARGLTCRNHGKNFRKRRRLLGQQRHFQSHFPRSTRRPIPHKTWSRLNGRASSPFAFVISNDPRVPDEVSYKAGYVNAVAPPRDFKSALLWGIAIVDTRVPGHESAEVEIASTQLICRVDGKDVILNDDKATFVADSTAANPGSAPISTTPCR